MSIEESSKLSYTFKTINIDDSLEFKIILDVLPALVVVFVQLITRLFTPPGEIMVRFRQAQAQLSIATRGCVLGWVIWLVLSHLVTAS